MRENFLYKNRFLLLGVVVIVFAAGFLYEVGGRLFPRCEEQIASYEDMTRDSKRGVGIRPLRFAVVKPSCDKH